MFSLAFQGSSGFGRGQKSLVNLGVFLGKKEIKERKDRVPKDRVPCVRNLEKAAAVSRMFTGALEDKSRIQEYLGKTQMNYEMLRIIDLEHRERQTCPEP